MSGFATDWLDLREPADHDARAPALLTAAAEMPAGAASPRIVDLGCGTGSTVRAFAGRLPETARWRLVDHDPVLLQEARRRFRGAEMEIVEADLRDIASLPVADADLVTASALFDLVSQDWLEIFVARLAERTSGLYAVLNYDGRMEFKEPHQQDRAVVDAFNEHQRGDKGFGPALGPDSGSALAEAFGKAGFSVETADSAWHLVADRLRDETMRGVAQAVSETGRVPPNALKSWLTFRLASRQGCVVGHCDVLARPPGRPSDTRI